MTNTPIIDILTPAIDTYCDFASRSDYNNPDRFTIQHSLTRLLIELTEYARTSLPTARPADDDPRYYYSDSSFDEYSNAFYLIAQCDALNDLIYDDTRPADLDLIAEHITDIFADLDDAPDLATIDDIADALRTINIAE